MSNKQRRRFSMVLDPHYPIEKEAIELLNAVPAEGEHTAFLRALLLIGFEDLKKNNHTAQEAITSKGEQS